VSLKYVGKLFLNLFYPPICPLCERFVATDGMLCDSCMISLQHLEADAILPHLSVSYFDRCISCFAYEGGLRRAIHSFKYQQRLEQVRFFSAAIKSRILDLTGIDIVIPVPMHRSKLRARGYNQAALLAKRVGRDLGKDVIVNALKRIQDSAAQMGLERTERLRNVKHSFAVLKKYENVFDGKSILLVDDVVTTGATINECARVLKKSGASMVHVVTVARTLE
jgi:competence protein ComFC